MGGKLDSLTKGLRGWCVILLPQQISPEHYHLLPILILLPYCESPLFLILILLFCCESSRISGNFLRIWDQVWIAAWPSCGSGNLLQAVK